MAAGERRGCAAAIRRPPLQSPALICAFTRRSLSNGQRSLRTELPRRVEIHRTPIFGSRPELPSHHLASPWLLSLGLVPCLPWLALVIVSPARPLAAQTMFATITGRVTDPSGAAMPGVRIVVEQAEAAFLYETATNQADQYTVANLRDGTFELLVTSAVFRDYRISKIVLAGRQTRRLDIRMQVGSFEAAAQISAGENLLETETAAVADTKDRMVLRALPLTSRRAWDYFTLTPQVERTQIPG